MKRGAYQLLLTLFTFALVSVGGFWYYRQSRPVVARSAPVEQPNLEGGALLAEVAQLTLLPAGQPTIFKIQDPASLIAQQAFFLGAEVGDSLIVYPDAGKAILYSSRRRLIVNMGPVTFDTKIADPVSEPEAPVLDAPPPPEFVPAEPELEPEPAI